MASSKVLKVPGAKMPKMSSKLPTTPKAPTLGGTTAENLRSYAQTTKATQPKMSLPKLPKAY